MTCRREQLLRSHVTMLGAPRAYLPRATFRNDSRLSRQAAQVARWGGRDRLLPAGPPCLDADSFGT